MRLNVLQFDRLVGHLESTQDRGVVFQYDQEYLSAPGSRALSLSLPLREKPYSQASAMPFFSGLLPDGDLRRRIADYLHVSGSSTLRLLDALGGECAGTVSMLREVEEQETNRIVNEEYEEIPAESLAELFLESARRPLLAPWGGARLSLAGAQEKIPLLLKDGRWFRPLGTAASSHILKPASAAFPDLVANEFFCMRLASSLGIAVPRVEYMTYGRPVLVVLRYDRQTAPGAAIERIHQEDACQALGIMPDRKYQTDGGPGFIDLARLIRSACSNPLPDIEALLRIALFNFLMGNCDAHGKNFSLLFQGSRTELAPFYDLVATTVYPDLETKLSMRIGKEYRIDRIGKAELAGFAQDAGVKPRVVMDDLDGLIATVPAIWDRVASLRELAGSAELIDRIRSGFDERAKRVSERCQ
jgi:serine/threonine-protein kinase HipA